MSKESILLNPEKMMYIWWAKIRWFIVLLLFTIGMLRVGQVNQTYPSFILMTTFIGISILNVLFHLQIIKTNNFISSFQILLDIIFATMVVHLTGGLHSSFVWIFLLAVITASLSIDKFGGVAAAMIGSMCLLGLILMYNHGILTMINNNGNFEADISDQTIFIISYTGLFTGIAFIASYISLLLKKISSTSLEHKHSITLQNNIMEENKLLLEEQRNKLKPYQEVVKVAGSIAGIDHDINNPLTIISLSIRRILKAGNVYNDEKLIKSGNQMMEAINSINNILLRLQKLKSLELIQKERRKQQG